MDLSEHDDEVLNFVERVAKKLSLDSIDFFHVVKNLDLPKEIVEKYPDLITPLDESIKGAIKERLNASEVISSQKSVKVHVLEGNKLQTITQFVREKDIDLLVTNKGLKDDELNQMLPKIARNITCDVAIVPPEIPDDINQVLVPIDFSLNSCMALQFAELLADVDPSIQIHGLHIYNVPSGYRKMGKTYDEFADVMLKNADSQAQKFFEDNGINGKEIHMHYLLRKGDSVPTMINKFALSHNIDMVLIGSRGRNVLSSFVLGSITEGLINRDIYLPFIVVKNKGESLKLWQALMEL